MDSKYWQKTHKYGLHILYTVKEAVEIDKKIGTHYGGMPYYREWKMYGLCSKHARIKKKTNHQDTNISNSV